MDVSSRLTLLLELDELKSGSATTKEITEVLKKLISLDGVKRAVLEKLVDQIRHSYGKMLDSVKRRRSITSKLDMLYRFFHEFSVNEGFDLCHTCEKDLGLRVPEILWQLLLEKEFVCYLNTHLVPENQSAMNQSTTDGNPRELSDIEKNAVRYTAGFVIHKLQERYKKVNTKEGIECLAALHDMGRKMKADESGDGEQEHCSTKWIKLATRGGLCFVEDMVYDLFVTIELIVDGKLSEIFQQGGKGIEQVNKENLSWVCGDEDVQCAWNSISPYSIEEERVRQDLLKEIIHMWLTTRGHSKTRQIKEDLKSSKKKTIKGTRSLRKELESQ